MKRKAEAARLPGRGRRDGEPAGSIAGMLRGERGVTLLEIVVALSLAMVLVAAAIPRAQSMVHESRLRGAAFHLRGLMRQVRFELPRGAYATVVLRSLGA